MADEVEQNLSSETSGSKKRHSTTSLSPNKEVKRHNILAEHDVQDEANHDIRSESTDKERLPLQTNFTAVSVCASFDQGSNKQVLIAADCSDVESHSNINASAVPTSNEIDNSFDPIKSLLLGSTNSNEKLASYVVHYRNVAKKLKYLLAETEHQRIVPLQMRLAELKKRTSDLFNLYKGELQTKYLLLSKERVYIQEIESLKTQMYWITEYNKQLSIQAAKLVK